MRCPPIRIWRSGGPWPNAPNFERRSSPAERPKKRVKLTYLLPIITRYIRKPPKTTIRDFVLTAILDLKFVKVLKYSIIQALSFDTHIEGMPHNRSGRYHFINHILALNLYVYIQSLFPLLAS